MYNKQNITDKEVIKQLKKESELLNKILCQLYFRITTPTICKSIINI